MIILISNTFYFSDFIFIVGMLFIFIFYLQSYSRVKWTVNVAESNA